MPASAWASAPLGFRTAPNNIDAEQALLGAILVNNESYRKVADFLKPEHFYESAHGRIFAAMSRLIDAGYVADHVTMKREFDDDPALRELNGAQYLAGLARAAETILNAEDYGRLLLDLSLRRGLITVCEKSANSAYDPTDTTAAIGQIQACQDQLDRLALEQPGESWRSVAEICDTIAKRLAEPSEVFSTGLPTLDNSMAGGIHRGAVYGFEARIKQFKTGTMGTIALSLMQQNVPFLFLALEMGDERIIERMIASETRCNAVRFRKRQDPADLIDKVQSFGGRYAAQRAYFANVQGLHFEQLRRIAPAAVSKLGIKVLFLDFWQRINGRSATQSAAQFQLDTAYWLADFAPQYNCAVVLASQENRQGESYGSDGLAMACDWLCTLHKVEMDRGTVGGSYEALWGDVKYNRDGPDSALGDEKSPAFRIDKIGPILREMHGS